MAKGPEFDLARIYNGVDFGDPKSAEGFRALFNMTRQTSAQHSERHVSAASASEPMSRSAQESLRVSGDVYKA